MKRKIFSLILSLTLLLSFGFGCGGTRGSSEPTDIEIYYWKAGLGLEFMQQTVEAFNESQSEYTATLDYDANAGTIIQSLQLGEDNTYDLYFTMLNTHQYDEYFISLDDVLDNPATGETVDIRQKYYPYLLEGIKNSDGTTHFLNYGNTFVGIVYNATIIDGENYKIPRTTKELASLTRALYGDSALHNSQVSPWIFYNDSIQNGYWNYMMYAWAAQYEGVMTYYKELLGLDKAGVSMKDKLLEKDGRYEALKALESIITPTLVHPESTSTNFTKVQTNYLSGEAVMTVNGSWLLKETNMPGAGTGNKFAMMKTPIISSIVDKLTSIKGTENEKEETLRRIIDEVDANPDAEASPSNLCSPQDFLRVKEAREVMATNAFQQYVFIPEYSPAIDGAKEFLRFFYSDVGTLIYNNATKLPASVKLTDESKFDTSKLPLFNRTQFETANKSIAVGDKLDKAQYFLDNSCDIMNTLTFAQYYIASNPTDLRSAEDLFGIMKNRIIQNLENQQ